MIVIYIHSLQIGRNKSNCSSICDPVMLFLFCHLFSLVEVDIYPYISVVHLGIPFSWGYNILLLNIRVIISRGSLSMKFIVVDPLGEIGGNPDLSRSSMLSIVPSYLIGMREDRSVVLYPSVSMFPRTIHLRIANFLILNPGLSIHLLSLLLGISSVERKISAVSLLDINI